MFWRKKMLPAPAKLQPITPTPIEGKRTGPPKRKTAGWQDIFFIHAIPGQDDEEGLLVLADGSMRKLISCKPLNVLLSDAADRERLAKDFASLADSLKCDIQILVSSRNLKVDEFLSRYQRQITTNNQYLSWYADYIDKWFRRVQDVHFVPQREFYVVVGYQPPDCRHLTRAWSDKRSPEKQEEYTQDLNSYCKKIFEQLCRSNLCPAMLTRQETRNLVYAHLNPALTDRESDAEPAPSRPGSSEAELLARSALKIADNYLWLDGKFVGTQYMQHIPQVTWFGWLVDLLTMSCEYTVSFYIHHSPQDSEKSKLENERAFDISLYIKTHADSLERLNLNMEEIRRVFKKNGAIVDRAQTLQLAAWQSTLPVGVDKLETVHRVSSRTVGSFWPFFTAMCGMKEGVPFGFAVASREPVLLNPFYRGAANDASNIFVAGAPGSGKSFAVSMLILRLLPLGVRFVLIDKTAEDRGAYRFITELLGPEFCGQIKLGPGSAFVLNPFDLGPDDGKAGEPSEHKVNTLVSLLELMLSAEETGALTDIEKELLAGLIRQAYSDEAVHGLVPTMSDLARIAARSAAAELETVRRDRQQQLASALSLITRSGDFGSFLDGSTNIDSEKLLIVFDTSEVNNPRLERITSFILAEFIRRKAAEALERKLKFAAIIDEAATLMKFKAGACSLADLSIRARLYNMLLITMTQELNHFFCQPEQADSILLNAHSKILLRQEPGDAQLLKEKLCLTDMETEAIENFAHDQAKRRDSQCLLIVGDSHGAIRLVPSPMDYWICTSESSNDIPRRLQKIEEIKAKHPTINHTDACRQAVYYLGLETD